MKIFYLTLLFSQFCFTQHEFSCEMKYYEGIKAADSLISSDINHRAWYDWNVFAIGTRETKFYRCEIENYFSYNSQFYREYAELLEKDSILLFPYYNFYESECFIKGVQAVTDSVLSANGFDEDYFRQKKQTALLKVQEHNEMMAKLTNDGNSYQGGEIIKKYSGSLEKLVVESYMKANNMKLPPFYFTPYIGNNSRVKFTVHVNRRGIVKNIEFGSFGEYSMLQGETPKQIELIKKIFTDSLLNKRVYTPYYYNGKNEKFKTTEVVIIHWK